MENFNIIDICEQIIMLFFILFLGIGVRKLKIIDFSSTQTMSKLLLNVTQPLLIINSFQIEFDKAKLFDGMAIAALSVFIHIFSVIFSVLFFKPFKNQGENKVYRLSFVFGNCAFLGFPVLKAVFGEETGIFYGAFYTIFFNIFIWTYGIALLKKGNEKHVGDEKINLRHIILNVGTLSTIIGIIFFVLNLKIPSVVFKATKSLGDMTFPLSMIIIGSLISEINITKILHTVKMYYFLMLKLIVLPLIVMALCILFGVDKFLIYTGVLMACVPTATTVAIFAENYECDAGLASQLIGITTFISLGSIPLVLYITSLFV